MLYVVYNMLCKSKNIGNKGRTLSEGERYSTVVNNLFYERTVFVNKWLISAPKKDP